VAGELLSIIDGLVFRWAWRAWVNWICQLDLNVTGVVPGEVVAIFRKEIPYSGSR
jgi:hypothetical protein